MRKARKRNWEKKTSPCYVEEHHIFPTSIYGPNNITVFLTAREHYVAHALLYKALKRRYGSNHSRAIKMQFAYWSMSNGQIKNRYVNSRLYEKLREEFSKAQSLRMSGENSPMWGRNSPFWGKTHSLEAKKKISEAAKLRTGENNPNWGKTHSPETKKKMSEKLSGENNPNWGKTLSPESKKKIGEALRGKTPSTETKKKMSEAASGKMWINNGEVSRLILKNSPIPPGFKRGMAKAQSGTGLAACESSSSRIN